MSLRTRVRAAKLEWAASARDLGDPEARRRALWYLMIFDHGALRSFWHNFAQIAPGVFRANHPSPRRLAYYAARGFRTIVNLRGVSEEPPYMLERASAAELGLTLVDVMGLSAREAPEREALLAALEAVRQAEKPVLIHCKSGADRTSLVAAIYLLAECGASLDEARRHFSPRYIHFKWTKTGVLDHILDSYAAAADRIGFEEWLRTTYNGAEIQASFDGKRAAT